ncbi:MAG: hypothetical protein AAGE52_28705 [Myxococcota bacterium]
MRMLWVVLLVSCTSSRESDNPVRLLALTQAGTDVVLSEFESEVELARWEIPEGADAGRFRSNALGTHGFAGWSIPGEGFPPDDETGVQVVDYRDGTSWDLFSGIGEGICERASGFFRYRIEWLPDDRLLVRCTVENDERTTIESAVYRVSRDGNEVERLGGSCTFIEAVLPNGDLLLGDRGPGCSSDGRWLSWTHADGVEPLELEESARIAGVSSLGVLIAEIEDDDRGFVFRDVHWRDLETGERTPVVDVLEPGSVIYASSSDGVLPIGTPSGTSIELSLLAPDGTETPVRMPACRTYSRVHSIVRWSEDALVAGCQWSDGSVPTTWMIQRDGTTTPLPVEAPEHDVGGDWHPDSNQFLRRTSIPGTGRGRWFLDRADGTSEVIPTGASSLGWSRIRWTSNCGAFACS